MQPPAEGLASRLFLVPALRTQPDRRLVALVREGYETAFEEIVRRYGRPLSRYAASIVGGRCDDVLQDAFSRALLALRRDDAEIELRPWLFRIVRNTALNDLRDRPPSPEVLAESLVGGGGNPSEELERREELADLVRRLQALPEAQRAALVMRELEGLSHEEIARALGMSGGAARQAIHRARRALRDGIGMLVPLPLLQSLLAAASTPGAAETATGVAGIGGVAGAGMALKATAATVLVAGTVGAGVALKPDDHSGGAEPASAQAAQSPAGAGASDPIATGDGGSGNAEGDGGDDRHGGARDGGPHRGSGHGGASGAGNDRGGHGQSALGDDRDRAREPSDDHGSHGETELGNDRGGRSGPSEHQGGSSGPGGEDRSGSGSGDSGSGSNQGPGGGDPGSGEGSDLGGEPTLEEGSGPSSGSDSSGSGSGSTPEPEDDHSGPG